MTVLLRVSPSSPSSLAVMWSNLVLQQDEDGRGGTAALGKSGRSGKRLRPPRMSDSQEGKIKLAFFIALIGVTLMVLGMGTAFWVELSQPKHFRNNQTCEMAHYGLWKSCVRTLWVSDIDPERESCGPAELPGGESTHTHTHTHTRTVFTTQYCHTLQIFCTRNIWKNCCILYPTMQCARFVVCCEF